MRLPDPVREGVEGALSGKAGAPVSIRRASTVGGGCINPACRLETDRGSIFFLKWNSSADPAMFAAEAEGLLALAAGATGAGLRAPKVEGWGGSGSDRDPGWLLLEFIPPGPPPSDYGRRLGKGLARLHSSALPSPDASKAPTFGWARDNFIGSLSQENHPSEDWTNFWRDRRLEPQLRMARNAGHFAGERGKPLDHLLGRLDEVMAGAGEQGPALLHGDLWSGNFYPGPGGEPVLIDPAVYRGAGEVDLAMMELFGSFPGGFREGYSAHRPIPGEYEAFRKDLYQLYYLLVHVNLFGGSYVQGSLGAARRVLSNF